MKKLLLFLSFYILHLTSSAQLIYDRSDAPVIENGITKKFPWVGGLNNPQFSEADLNNDNILDLVIMDRMGDKFLTFINGGTPNTIDYTYEPKYEMNFPENARQWALLRDYDCDGIEDLFACKPGWIRRFHGYYNASNELSFTFVDTLLSHYYNSWSNLYVAAPDIPVIADMNGDGDLDVVTFQIAGGQIEYHENQSQEVAGNCAGYFKFNLESDCWGRVLEPASYDSTIDYNYFILDYWYCPVPLISQQQAHSGSTLLSFDEDNDGDQELVIGDVSYNNLVRLHNDGNADTAYCFSEDTLYPSYNISTDLPIFPGSFLADVNNDGLRDLLVAPNGPRISEDYNCVWHYKNVGSSAYPVWDFQTDTFLVEDILDLGGGSYPVFFDHNADGKKDLIIANRWYMPDSFNAVALYQNIGTISNPMFEMVTRDWMNLSSLQIRQTFPAFGDLDNDGDEDMIIGEFNGVLHYYRNTAGAGNTASFVLDSPYYQGIDVGNFSTPQLVDVDRDGLLDLLIGEEIGNLNYYRNTGALNTPVFTLQSASWGGVDVSGIFSYGNSVPFLAELDTSGEYNLLVGCYDGTLYHYNNIEGNLAGIFNLVTDSYEGIDQGAESSVCGTDINNDGLIDLAIGNFRGGIALYEHNNNLPPVSINMIEDTTICAGESVQLFAIPSGGTGNFWIEWEQSADLSCLDCTSPIAVPEAATTYYVMITDSNSFAYDSVTVTVIFPVANASNDVTICLGGSANISASGGTFYQWSPPAGLQNPFAQNTIASPSVTTTYTVAVTDLSGCTAYDSVDVIISTALIPDAGNDVAICDGQSAQLNGSGGIIFSWTPATGLSNPNIYNPTANPTATTTYTLNVSDTVCDGVDSVIVTVNSVPVLILPSDQNLCTGDTVQLVANGANEYDWNPSTGLSCDGCSSPLLFVNTTTTYTVIGTSSNCSDTDQITIYVIPEVQANFNYSVNGLTVTFTNLSTGATDFYWTFGDGSTSPLSNPSHTYNQSGIYTITLTSGNSCFDDVYSVTINLYTGVISIDEPNSIQLFPNPNDGRFTLRCDADKIQIEVLNVVGQKLFEEERKVSRRVLDHTFNTGISSSGIYFVRLKIDGYDYVSKMIVK